MKLRQPGGLVIYRHHDGKPRTGAARWAAVPRTCHIISPLGGVLFGRHCVRVVLVSSLPSPWERGRLARIFKCGRDARAPREGVGWRLAAHRLTMITHGRPMS